MGNKDSIRQAAEQSLYQFIRLVAPNRVLGECHRELISWWERPDRKSHQLVLLPRDHQKSALLGFRCAQRIVRDPTARILYVSATERLAIKQLKFIKDILLSDAVQYYWPNLVCPEETRREKWTETEISVDDPRRREAAVRDPTIIAAGLTTNLVGLHCDIGAFDDVVVPENVTTREQVAKVHAQYGYLSSIEGTDAEEWVTGTTYRPDDLYYQMREMTIDVVGPAGDIVSSEPLFDVYEKIVEDSANRDGSGKYLWPREQREDGKWFGFSPQVLAKKRAAYKHNIADFYSQYYNDPNAHSETGIQPEHFQYYNRDLLRYKGGFWEFAGRRLNILAAIDFAFSVNRDADWTAIVVVGVDSLGQYFILDIDRFKTPQISEYFKHILRMHEKWKFNKIRAEVTSGQSVIVRDLKDNYIRPLGLALAVEDFTPPNRDTRKAERIQAILQPKYENRQIWHFQDGEISTLEAELTARRPAHDDVKDALAICVDGLFVPLVGIARSDNEERLRYSIHPRFGGLGPIRNRSSLNAPGR